MARVAIAFARCAAMVFVIARRNIARARRRVATLLNCR